MSIRLFARPVVLAVMLGAAAAQAQSTAPVTEVGAPPAEERSSTGAVVLEQSLVKAQRDKAFEQSSARTGVVSLGRGVLRATSSAETQAELASQRAREATDLRQRGAGTLIKQ